MIHIVPKKGLSDGHWASVWVKTSPQPRILINEAMSTISDKYFINLATTTLRALGYTSKMKIRIAEYKAFQTRRCILEFGDGPLVINCLQTPVDSNACGPVACLSLRRDLQHALDDVSQEASPYKNYRLNAVYMLATTLGAAFQE